MNRTLRLATGVTTLGAALLIGGTGPAVAADDPVAEPDTFTSMFTTMATPDAVIDTEGNPAPGEPGATGTFNFRINSDLEIICYDILLRGVTPPYQSMARTATHVHEANAGSGGPPRLAFPDPEDAGDGTLRSSGCMQGPFTTGILADGVDSLAEIEADPAGFSADTHTANFVPGAVRGQLTAVPMGGVDTGGGGTAGGGSAGIDTTLLVGVSLAGLAAVGAGVGLNRRRGDATS
jgi:hypothetical protein